MPKISKYTAATSVADADTGVIVQGGVTKRVLMSVVKAFCGGEATPAPTPTAVNDFQVATGSPLAWAKKTLTEVKTILGIGGTVPAPTAANDFMVGAGSPLDWAKKTLAEAKTILGVDEKTLLVMLLDKDAAIAVVDGIGNVEIPVPADWNGLAITDVQFLISPSGTASTSGGISFQLARIRPTDSPTTVDVLTASPAMSIAQDEKTSSAASIETGSDDLATGDFLRPDCDGAGTGAKGPLWLKITAE